MRPKVKEVAKWYIYDMKCLTDVLMRDHTRATKKHVPFATVVTS